MMTATVSPSALADWLIGRGRHFITTDEVAQLVGVEPTLVSVSLQRARDAEFNETLDVLRNASLD